MRITSEYDGSSRGDDNDVYMRIVQPSGDIGGLRNIQSKGRDHTTGALNFGCVAHSSEWEGKPWWLELTLYAEEGGPVVNQQRFMDVDCQLYWVHINKDARMELHVGPSPDTKPHDRPIPGFDAWMFVGICIAVASVRRSK
jgi:hypothetical protein